MALKECLLVLLITQSVAGLADDKDIMKDHMYLPFKEERQFAVLSVEPERISTSSPTRANVHVEFYAHRYPGKTFNGKTYKYARHAESWCFDEIGTMWTWYNTAHKQTPPKMYLYTLNSPCHDFCVGNIIKFRQSAPFSSSKWYLGYTKMWHTTTPEDLKKLEDADIVLYKIEEKRRIGFQNVSFDSEMKTCVTEFLDIVCDFVATDQVHEYTQKVISKCGKEDTVCWKSFKMPNTLAKGCNYNITESGSHGYPLVHVTITGEERMEACRMTSQHLQLESDANLKWKVV